MRKMKTKMKTKCLFFIMSTMMLCSASIFAQQKTVSGVVTEADGMPVIGASILVKGTSVSTASDIDGNFSINVPDGASTLVFTYVGLRPKEVAVTGSVMNVVLENSLTDLEEVVVIGYGTVKKKDLTGSVVSVSGDKLQAVPVNSAMEAITGKMAGVQVTTTEGSPDADIKIRVRGGGSITGDNTPLFIVDGFPVSDISDIPPSDIESIDVLKDASSTAIYGSRGANGVIIITTKSGKEGKVNVTYNAFVGWKKMAKQLDVLAPGDYARWQYERAMLADGKPDKYTKFFGNWQDIDIYDTQAGNNWQEQVFGRTGFTFNQNLNINGGGDKTKYAFSYNHINDKAIMQLSSFKRDNLSLKLNNKPSKKITLDFSARYSNTEIKGGGANEQKEISSADSRLKYAMIYPNVPVSGLADDAAETDPDFNLYNPLVAIADNDQLRRRVNFNLNGGVRWEIIKGLQFRTEVGMDDYRDATDRFYGTTTYYVKNNPSAANQGKPAVIFTKIARNTIRNTNTLNYDFKQYMPENHTLNVLVGQEFLKTETETLTSTVHGFPANFTFADATNLSAQGTAYAIENHWSPDDKLLSYFGRANYNYQDKYLLSATFRADGSSRFSEGNRWGYFPSAALAWRISSESFMESMRHHLDDLKLRLSYGTAGNNNIPLGQMEQTYGVSSTSWVNGNGSFIAPSKIMANPDLTWETTITRNAGIDYSLFNGRLSGNLEGYINSTKDLLILFPVPGSGYDNQYRNMGETENRGVEFSVNWVALDTKNFGLSFSGNIGFNKNKIVSLGAMDDFTAESGWASSEIGADYMVAVGGSVGKMYGYKSAGRYEVSDFEPYDGNNWKLNADVVDSSPVVGKLRPGSMKLQSLNGDNVVSEDNEDRTIIGDANPLHTGGFSINGRIYAFDISANFNWSYGNDIYNANKIEYTSTSKYHSRNMISEMAVGNRWTNLLPDGTICNDPDLLNEMNANTTLWSPYMKKFVFTDWAVEDGSFLRLNTLTLGYTLPKEIINKVKLSNCRFYVTGYNLFCLTNYSGFDPEVSTRRKTALTPGVDYSAYPKSRSFVIGVNLNF